MGQRKVWTPEEDRVLQEIVEVKQIKKWSSIARCMETETGKQCRERSVRFQCRWYNQLDPTISNKSWETEQQNRLFQFHRELGNRWTKIAQRFPGRTDNNVKNHYYSTLRKGMRRLNTYILGPDNQGLAKPLNSVQLSKIVIVAEDKFERKLPVDELLRRISSDISDGLIMLSREPEEQFFDIICKDLTSKITYFCRNYKKKRPKKKKKAQKLDEESPTKLEVKEEYVPKPRPRLSRSILQTIEPVKSENNEEEELPIDFPLQFFRNNFKERSPCSPLNNSNSLVIPNNLKMPPLVDNELALNSGKPVSLEASAGSSMFSALGMFWPLKAQPGTENCDLPKDQPPDGSPTNQ